MQNFFFRKAGFRRGYKFFFNELPPVKVDKVEKPANPEGLPVFKVPFYRVCHVRSICVRTAKNSTCVCRCLKNGMDMGADTILSMTIRAWAILPVNRNAVPVCEIFMTICVNFWK